MPYRLAFVGLIVGLLHTVDLTPRPLAATEPHPTAVRQQEDVPPSTRVPIPEATTRALRFYRSGMVLWVLRGVMALAIPITLLYSGWAARLRDLSIRFGGRWYLTTKTLEARGVRLEVAHAIYGAIYFTVSALAFLPLQYYATFVRAHAYELSNQSTWQWLGDAVLSYGLLLLVCAVAVPVFFFLIALSRRRWWLYATAVAAAFLLFVQTILPIWIIPLYDRLGPMNDRALEADIIALASRAGIEGGKVYEVAKSEDTNRVNAYVTGSFGTKRIVLWDTLLQKLDRRQVLFVMGHEMAHFVLGHTWKALLMGIVLVVATCYAVHRITGLLLRTFGARWGVDDMNDVAALPAIVVIVSIVAFIVTPVQMAFNRYLEHEADRFGLEITQDNYAAASTWLVLQRENLHNPRPGIIFRLWRATHPVLSDRITFANEYRPWETGTPLRYARHFRD